jgi:hypothetical protein
MCDSSPVLLRTNHYILKLRKYAEFCTTFSFEGEFYGWELSELFAIKLDHMETLIP